MGNEAVIAVENVSKKYQLGLTGFSGFRKPGHGKEDFWALRDINFNVKRGEVLGIVGKNGAGKSTLLKLLSRITTPTEGTIKIKGRVASLLEVGTGFHPELTGLENIYLNGTILGMSRAEIDTHLDEIIEFAGIPHHIHSPVKRYSSGMKVRLGFAVAAHLNPEILIVDEVLAVGDAEFQAKCLGKIKEVTQHNRTVLFVSHNMAAVSKLCTSAILLRNGKITMEGETSTIIEGYASPEGKEHAELSNGIIAWNEISAPKGDGILFNSVKLVSASGETKSTFSTSEPIKITLTYTLSHKIDSSRIVLIILDENGNTAFASTNQNTDKASKEPGTYVTSCTIPADLLNQNHYQVILRCGIPAIKKTLIDEVYALTFNTILMGNNGSISQERWPGVVAPLLQWETIKNN